MNLRNTVIIAAMAGSMVAPGQSGFIVHLDSVQAGRSGGGYSVREVDDGFLVFSAQNSQQLQIVHTYMSAI